MRIRPGDLTLDESIKPEAGAARPDEALVRKPRKREARAAMNALRTLLGFIAAHRLVMLLLAALVRLAWIAVSKYVLPSANHACDVSAGSSDACTSVK